MDMFLCLLATSDPFISLQRKLLKKKEKHISDELRHLLIIEDDYDVNFLM